MIPYRKHYMDEGDIQAVVEVLRCGEQIQRLAIESLWWLE